jgi:hypothetical protein
MDLTPIANKLEFEGLGTQGSTLFINYMPMECRQGILLRTPLVGTHVDPQLPGYFKSEVIVVVRTPQSKYEEGLALTKEAMRALTMYDTELDDISVKRMYPHKLPVTFPVTEGNFFEILVRFDIVFCGEAYGNPY